jgi:hypothetical protein
VQRGITVYFAVKGLRELLRKASPNRQVFSVIARRYL